MKALVLAAVVMPALLLAQAQRDNPVPAQTGEAVIAGTVVSDDEAARPVRRVVVSVSGGGVRGQRETVTDDAGHFAIGGLPDGRYTLSARKGGWLTTFYGSTHPGRPAFGGSNVNLKAGTPTQVTIRLLHGSAVSGTLTDAFGRPVANVFVRLVSTRTADGQRTVTESIGVMSEQTTDDRGMFRLYGIAPGDYVLIANVQNFNGRGGRAIEQLTPEDLAAARRSVAAGAASTASSPSADPLHGPTVTYAQVYYPGVVDMGNAATITIGRNEERTGLDFALQLIRTSRVQGVVLSPDGQPVRAASVQLMETGDAGLQMFDFNATVTQANGEFEFRGVTPGAYSVVARAADSAAAAAASGLAVGAAVASTGGSLVFFGGPGAGMPLFASEPMTAAGADVTGLTLRLQHGAIVSGHAVFAGTGTAPDPRRVRVVLQAVTDSSTNFLGNPGTTLDASGAFQIVNVPPGRYRVNAFVNTGRIGMAGDASWIPRSAMVGSSDVLDQPFEVAAGGTADLVVTFADHLAEISGRVTNAAGQPVSDYRIVVLSADQAYWGTTNRRMKAPVSTDPDGSFRVENLPAGDYLLAAVTDMDPEDLTSKAFLADLATHALHLTLGENEKKVQNLSVGGR